jgi:hypothetical protein
MLTLWVTVWESWLPPAAVETESVLVYSDSQMIEYEEAYSALDYDDAA